MDAPYILVIATISCFSIGFSSLAQAAVCDVDKDGDVDRLDISLIISARNKPAGGPADPRDANGDGNITLLDARSCVRQCDLPGCTITAPVPSSPTDITGKLDAPVATPIPNAVKDASKPGLAASEQSSPNIQGRKVAIGAEWKVKRGDTLYSIGRTVFPGDARKQARLREDVMKLNPSVFARGANNMAVGVVLKLPAYVVPESATFKAGDPAPVSIPVTVEVTPRPAVPVPIVKPQPDKPKEVESAQKKTLKSEPVEQVKIEQPTVKGQLVSVPSRAEGGVLVSLGFSYGGDELLDTDGLLDFTAGSGGHVRIGYEQMSQHGSGYRIALGLQYVTPYENIGDASFRDAYLQLAYQYRVNPVVYGIGVVLDSGATLKNGNDPTIDYDSATGAVVFLENVGSGDLAGWGLSYTDLEIEEKNSSTSVDASRVELYYSWRF